MKDAKKGPPDWYSLRLWQIQPIRDLMLLASILGVLYLGYVLRIVTVPILLAIALAYLIEPLVRRVTRNPLISRQGAAVALIVLGAVIVVVPAVFGLGFAVVQGASAAAGIATNTSNLVASVKGEDTAKQEAAYKLLTSKQWRLASVRLRELRAEVEQHQRPDASPPEGTEADAFAPVPATETKRDLYNAIDMAISALQDNAAAIAKSVGQRAIGTGTEAFAVAVRTLGSIGVIVFQLLLTAFFFFFFCTGWGRVLAFWESLIPERRKNRVVELVQKMDRVIAGFIRGRLLICLVVAIVLTSLYFAMGVPVPLILGPVVGLCFLIPFTHWIGALIVMTAMVLQPSHVEWQTNWWWIVFAPIGANTICQILDDYVLTPRIQGKNTDLSMPSILFASISGGALAGFYGLLIAIPTAACVKILLKEVFWPRFEAWGKGEAKDFLPIEHDEKHGEG
jgi:predicted PurR-regulated permease PerM